MIAPARPPSSAPAGSVNSRSGFERYAAGGGGGGFGGLGGGGFGGLGGSMGQPIQLTRSPRRRGRAACRGFEGQAPSRSSRTSSDRPGNGESIRWRERASRSKS